MESNHGEILNLTEEVKSRINYLLREKYPKNCNSFEKKFLSFLNGKGPSPTTSEGIKWIKYARSLSIYKEKFTVNYYRGLDKSGLDQRGFNIAGVHFETLTIYDNNGFDKNGYDKDGFSERDGYNKDGFDRCGYNRKGKDKDGYNRHGFKEGYDINGYDKYGFDKNGVDVNGKKGKTLEERKREGILEYFNSKMEEPEKEEPQAYGGIYSTTDGQ